MGKRGYRALNHLNLCWDGEAISGSRIGRKHPRIERPALTCGLFAQRAPWFDLLKQGAAVSSGYLPRFLIADVPPTRRRAPFEGLPAEVSRAWNDGICALLALDRGVELALSRDAARLNADSFNEFQGVREGLPSDDPFTYWLEKAPQNVLRVAALLHLAGDGESNTVSADHLARARSIVRVLMDQTRGLVKNEPRSSTTKGNNSLSAPIVLDRAEALFGRETFKVSELVDRMGRAARGKTSQLKKQLDTLVASGAVERFPRRSTGGRAEGPFYVVRQKKAQLAAKIEEMPSFDDALEARDGRPTPMSRSLYLTDRADGTGQWLDLSALDDDEMISVSTLRARLGSGS